MRRFAFIAILTSLVATLHIAAQNVSEAELRYREAVRKQQVDGDIPAAIKLYQDIAASKIADRATKARALMQLASCYETLGRDSQTTYEQIVRDFGDQPAAAQARAKLASMRSSAAPSTMTVRKIELGEGVQDVVATDGQKAVYWSSNRTTLYFGDIRGKNRQVVFEPKEIVPEVSVSRDLTTAFMYFQRTSLTGTPRWAVIKTDGTGYREFTPTINGERLQVAPLTVSWSWDNRYLLVYTPGIFVFKVSLADGKALDLLGRRPLAGGIISQFSPDGNFIAYGESGSVYVISAQGGSPRLIAERATLGDWTPDGRYLMIQERPPAGVLKASSDSRKIWAVPVQNGQAAGEQISIASSLGLPEAHPNGTLIVKAGDGVQGRQVVVATLDSEDRLSPWKALNLIDEGRQPSWSPDGSQIVYDGRNAVRVHTLATGEDREVYRGSTQVQNCLWARTQPKLFCGRVSNERPQRFEVLSIALDSGRVETIGFLPGFFRFLLRVSPDDRKLITGTGRASEWEIGTDPASEKDVPRYSSADGLWVFRLGDSNGRRRILVRSTSGENDDLRLLVQTRLRAVDIQYGPIPLESAPDSKSIVYQDRDADGKDGLYRVSLSGGPPTRLGDYPSSEDYSYFSMSPDGRKFLVEVRILPKEPEFWVLENAIPKAKAVTK